jgi:GNAT superfamily N-acetyltransferase
MRFRAAVTSDIATLLGLQAAYYLEDGYPFEAEGARACWSLFLGDASLGRAWVAEGAGGVVAYLVMTFGYSFEYRGRDAWVDELYVAPIARHGGLGQEALRVSAAACEELGLPALHLEIEPDNPGARALYQRAGFSDLGRALMTRRTPSR